MGSAASVNDKPRCPYDRMCEAKIKKAKNTSYIDGDASDFYSFCSNGNIDQVRQILEAPDRRSIDELVKLERNGDSALHVATEKGHVEIVKLLLEHGCSRTILNRTGKVASEVATTPVMQKLFIRSESSDRFHESDTNRTMTHYLPKDNTADTTSNEPNTTSIGTNATNNEALQFVQKFETEKEVCEYSLNYQTTAMWLRFFNWLTRTFPRRFQRDNLNLDSFVLHNDADFNYFLKKKLGEKYQGTLKKFAKAQETNSIDPLLTIYSNQECGFYQSLNKQLAASPNEPDTSPHLCDRFIIEFHIRGDELEKRCFTGTTYRGATMTLDDLSLYEKVCKNKPRGVIGFKAFTSTSKNKDVALQFIPDKPLQDQQINVLFIIETKVKSPTIIGIADVSEYKYEEEILFMPGNLFIVKKIVRDVVHTVNITQKSMTLTEVHLEYLHISVSFLKKLVHTYRSANKNSVIT